MVVLWLGLTLRVVTLARQACLTLSTPTDLPQLEQRQIARRSPHVAEITVDGLDWTDGEGHGPLSLLFPILAGQRDGSSA